MVVNAESIVRIFEAVGEVLGKVKTDNMLTNYRIEDLEKKLENAEKEIEALKGGVQYEEIRK